MGCSIQNVFTDSNGIIGFNAIDYSMFYSNRTEVDTSTLAGQIEAYTKCASVQDAIDMKASYHSSLKISAIDDKGNWLGGDTGTASQKALIKQDLQRLAQFNPKEGFIRFNHRLKTHIHAFGVCYVHKFNLVGFKDKFDYYIIPNNIITPVYDNRYSLTIGYERKVVRYDVNVGNGETLKLSPEEVIVFTDRIAGFQSTVAGGNNTTSRLVALREPISTLLSMGQMLTQLLADGGARGIIAQGASDDNMLSAPFLSEEKRQIQNELKQYGQLRGQFKYIVTKSAAQYVPLTAKIIDMELPAIALMRKIDVYRAFGIPTAFAVNESRFKVLPEARKELFTSSVIPEGEDIFETLCKLVGMPDRDWQYKPDWSHMDFFQESLKESGVALQQAGNGLVPMVTNGILTQGEARTYLQPYLR